ncbi:MAG: prepilin-type N-terminal cleavage/methylation domain-containing protein, partial [Bdellovibrionaceae bacterium]|nr:prepilin-type N-terminal cleavage/methylation domain-containing protein [Pseudobdellovibrionaceae bacterium]
MDTLIHSDQSDVKIRIPSAIFSLRNDRGITLLEVVIVGAIGTLIAMAVGDLLIASSKWRLRLETKAALQSVSQEIRILLENDGSWQTTLTHADNATTFACLTGPSGCTTGGSFSIFHRNGERAFDGLSGTLAYTAKGTRCDSFPNGSCMYRMTIDWVPGCTS